MEDQIKAWALTKIQEAKARRNWSSLPAQFEHDAVRALFAEFRAMFDKRAIKARVNASKASTFADLERAVISA